MRLEMHRWGPGVLFASLLFAFLLLPSKSFAQDDNYSSEESEVQILAPDLALEGEVKEHLKDDGYRFCQDPQYRLFEAEKQAICHQLPAFEDRCPKLRAACARPAWEADMQVDADESWFDWSFLDLNLRGVAGLFKLIFWGALAIGAVLLLRALIRQARHWKEERDLEAAHAPTNIASPTEDPGEELRSQVLFQMAREELAKNNVTESLHLTYRATVRALSDAEWVKPHKSKTSGDYLRNLRKIESADPSLPVGDVRTHLLDLDRERFRSGPSSEQAATLLERALSIAGKLAQAGVFLLGFSAIGCDYSAIPEPPTGPQAPRGKQLFEDLLKERALSVSRRMMRVTDLPENTTSVIAVDAHLRELEWETIRDWLSRSGGHLVVANPGPTFNKVFGLDVKVDDCSAPLVAPDLSLYQFGESGFLRKSIGGSTLASCGSEPFAVSLSHGGGWLTVVADDSLFENVSLAAGDNATLALHLVGYLEGHVEYLGPWTGRGAHHPLQSVGRAGFGWWVLHVLLLGALYAWSRGKRFGTPTDPPEVKRRAFSEHARALSLKYEQAGASGWALRHYAEWVLDTLRRRAPSTKGDLKSLTRAVSSNEREAAKLREALTTARRADELGESRTEHNSTFLRLKSSILGISEVSRRSKETKE